MKNATDWLAAAAIGGGVAFAVWKIRDTADLRRWEPRIMRAYQRAARALGVHAPALVITEHAPNAYSDGVEVGVNPRWVRDTLAAHCRGGECVDQVLTGVLAHHGLGHAWDLRSLIGTPWETPARHDQELEADTLAGRALAALGLGRREFERVIGILSAHASATHPLGHRRVAAIRVGYSTA